MRSRRPSSPSVMVSPGNPASGLAPVSTLMPGIILLLARYVGNGGTVFSLLPYRFIVQNDPTDVSARIRRREQHFAVGAPIFLGRFQVDGVEPLADGARALVRRQKFLAGSRPLRGRSRLILWCSCGTLSLLSSVIQTYGKLRRITKSTLHCLSGWTSTANRTKLVHIKFLWKLLCCEWAN